MEPSTDVSAPRSWGGTLPGVSAIVAMLSLEGAGDVLVRDRAESLVLGADLEAHDDGLVVDLVGQRLGSDAVLRLALDGRVLQPFCLRLDALVGPNRQLARQQEVAAVSVRDILHVAGLADIRDILGQHHPHLSLALRYRLIRIPARDARHARPDSVGEPTSALACGRDRVAKIVIEDALAGFQRQLVLASHVRWAGLDKRLDREYPQR